MFKILVSDQLIGSYAYELFSQYEVDVALNSHEILEKTQQSQYDLFIVNFNLYTTMEELKNFGNTTTILFIDEYYDIYHIKKCFEIGDAYLVKPLNFEELAIRVSYYFKKQYTKKSMILTYKTLFFHTKTKQLFKENLKMKLSPNESLLVELFLTSKEKPLSKYLLLEELNSTSEGALRVHISKLKKFGLDISFSRAIGAYILN